MPLEHFLGIHLKKNRTSRILSLSQQSCVDNILVKFDMIAYSPISTPLIVPCILSFHDSPHASKETCFIENILYHQVLGSVHYLVNYSLHDLSLGIVFLSRFMENPEFIIGMRLKSIIKVSQINKGYDTHLHIIL